MSANAATAATRVPLTGLARLARLARQPRPAVAAVAALPHDPHHARRSPRSRSSSRACGWRSPSSATCSTRACEQVQVDAQRATAAAQTTLDNAAVQGDGVQLQNLMVSVSRDPRPAVLERHDRRVPHRPALAERAPGLRLAPGFEAIISDELRDAGARGSRAAVVAVGRRSPREDGDGARHRRRPAAAGSRRRRLRALSRVRPRRRLADARIRAWARCGSSASASCCSSAASRGSCCDR